MSVHSDNSACQCLNDLLTEAPAVCTSGHWSTTVLTHQSTVAHAAELLPHQHRRVEHDLQALLDEQRNAQVNSTLLDTLITVKDATQLTHTLAELKSMPAALGLCRACSLWR